VFAQKPLSFAGDILDKLRNRWRGSKPVDKAFSGFSVAFFLEKLDENKFCGNHRFTWAVNWVKADRTTMAGNPMAMKFCCPMPAIVVNQALNVIPLGGV
jgi:hypothetical protein